MIVVFHKNNSVVKITNCKGQPIVNTFGNTIQDVLYGLSTNNPSIFIGWCHIDLEYLIALDNWNKIFKHRLIMASYHTSDKYFIDCRIGYVEDTPFINVTKKHPYPTWLMSSHVGGVHASILLAFEKLKAANISFDFFINTIAKKGITKGLICYSHPQLLKNTSPKSVTENSKISTRDLLWFIKSNYKFRWVLLFVLNNFIYQDKLYFAQFLSIVFKKMIHFDFLLDEIPLSTNTSKKSIDVIIPTLGRKKYLYDFMTDLANQTLMPTKVIIVEQHPIEGEYSKLDYIKNKWPFEIDHTLTHQLGACNARNIALSKVTSNWVFFADDDIRIEPSFLEKTFNYIHTYKADAVSVSCLQKGEVERNKYVFQSTTFGSGTSVVKSSSLKGCYFDMAYEFGYGEDADFGMQLRNKGVDILQIPQVSMLHLKAPSGGFRIKHKNEWDKENPKLKPSPTVMVYKLRHATKEQLKSYKTTLFIKYYKNQTIVNPFSYIRFMKKSWLKSIFWATKLINRNEHEV